MVLGEHSQIGILLINNTRGHYLLYVIELIQPTNNNANCTATEKISPRFDESSENAETRRLKLVRQLTGYCHEN